MNRRARLFTGFLIAACAGLPATIAGAASSPAVATGGASSITSASAVLHGVVNPNGAGTRYWLEWGLTTAYGSSSSPKSAGHGSTAVSVQARAGGLLPGTTYHYRLVASNNSGATTGSDRTFRTKGHPPPAAVTGPTAAVGRRQATVTGVVYPHGAATSYVFQWGPTPAYGSQTFAGVAPKGGPLPVSRQIAGLAPGTVFHYRVVALHDGSIAGYGADATFVTLPVHRQRPRLLAKVSPRHRRHGAAAFVTAGRLTGVPPDTAYARCPGTVSVSFLRHGRRAAHRVIPVAPDCTFSGLTVLRRLPRAAQRHRALLRVQIRFLGNGYLKPAGARRRVVAH